MVKNEYEVDRRASPQGEISEKYVTKRSDGDLAVSEQEQKGESTETSLNETSGEIPHGLPHDRQNSSCSKEGGSPSETGVVIEQVTNDDKEYNEYYLKCSGVLSRKKTALYRRLLSKKKWFMAALAILFGGAYMVYFGFSMAYSFGDEASYRLLFGTLFCIFVIVKINFGRRVGKSMSRRTETLAQKVPRLMRILRWFLYFAMVGFVVTYLSLTVVNTNPDNLICIGGMAVFILIGFLISKHADRVNWHAVFWGIGTQFVFALLILRTSFGYQIFTWIGDRIEEFLRHTDKGSEFLFGENYQDHYFAFAFMPLIISMSATVNVLYHFGVLQAFVANFGWFLTKCLGTSAVESVSTALSMFLGPPECPLAIKPFISHLTASELHAVMAANFASVSGSIFGMLIGFGVPANHLLTASVMSVPAALAMSKLIVPETRKTRIRPKDAYTVPCAKYSSALEAMCVGAVNGIKVVGNVMVNQLIFIAAIDFLDMALQWFGTRVGYPELTFALICAYVFYPFSYLMGFSKVDLFKIAELLGIKIFANSVVGFYEFGKLVLNRKALDKYVETTNGTWHWDSGNVILDFTNKTLVGGILTPRSEVIGTYALCGLNHLGAIGVTLGVMTALAPERNLTINKYVLRANISGHFACFLTACIAGLLYDGKIL